MSDPLLIAPRFRRSVRIDTDFTSVTAIDGFHCPASFQAAVAFMAAHTADTEQGAFTWTGPYGGGKSSLALALACLFGAPKAVREQAAMLFGSATVEALKAALPYFPARWDVLPLVTERRSINTQIAELLGLPAKAGSGKILKEIERRTQDRGLLLIMDELGRGLEAAADGEGDLHLLQDIAEIAARSQGRLIFLGILHQSFEEYAERLGRQARDSWAKIQGRFVDISISVSLEEGVELIGEALGHQRAVRKAIPLAERSVEQLRPPRKKVEAKRMAGKLARTAPLHPLTACLIGPLSRRRFGQNQRSVFSFLNSAEPFGLHDALARDEIAGFYPPHLLWNYLQANFEAAILSSPDGRRWALAHDVLERAIARGADETEQMVLKTIAVLEFLRERSGLIADRDTIALALNDTDPVDISKALSKLEQQSEIVFRKHTDAYVLYAGSDFDIDLHLQDIVADMPEVDLDFVRSLAALQPILAKRHHEETGAMRWFELAIEPVSALAKANTLPKRKDIIGRVVFALPLDGETTEDVATLCKSHVQTDRTGPTLVGYFEDAATFLDLARELAGLNRLVDEYPELRGDPVARREIDARTADVQHKLESHLHSFIDRCLWFEAGDAPKRLTKRSLNEHLSELAEAIFGDAPRLRNELLNCSDPSSNAVSARTKLMKRMVMRGTEAELGFAGANYPAERGLYISLLRETGVHEGSSFRAPSEGDTLFPLWAEADRVLAEADQGMVTAERIIEHWSRPPIGLKAGLGPVYISAYVLSRKDRVAVYGEGVFQSSFNELCVEFLARDAADVALRRVELQGFVGETLDALGTLMKLDNASDPLIVARSVIREFDSLVPWTTRTQSLSPKTLQVREVLKRASDPNRLLFDDLPKLTEPQPDGTFDAESTAVLLRDALAEMRAAYQKVLDELQELMLRELDVRGRGEPAWKALRDRADNIRQIGGDLKLEAFVGRLTQFHGTREDMEGIAGVAINKLPRDWNDGDKERAAVGLTELSTLFLKTESMARVKGRKDGRHAMAVMVGKENLPHSIFGEFEVADSDWQDVEVLATAVDKALGNADQQRREIILAALMEVTSKYLNAHDKNPIGERA